MLLTLNIETLVTLFCTFSLVDLLLPEFRFGWDLSIQAIASERSSKSAFQTFMVVMVKGKMGVVHTIESQLDQNANYCNMKQVLLCSSDKHYEM
jgi:hypothetical protein